MNFLHYFDKSSNRLYNYFKISKFYDESKLFLGIKTKKLIFLSLIFLICKQKLINQQNIKMGCQHSKLNTIQNQVISTPSQPQNDGKIPLHNYAKESKENIPLIKVNTNKQKKTTISPLNLQIISSDQPKISFSFSKLDLQMINNCIQKIENFEKMEQRNRKKICLDSSREKFNTKYLKEVKQFLARREQFYKQIIEQARQKSGFNKCTECQMKALIEEYLKSKPVPYFQVQSWVRQKTIIMRVFCQKLIKSLTCIQNEFQTQADKIPYYLNIIVEDMCEKQFSFRKTLALNYLYINILPQIQQWDSQSQNIHEKIITEFQK